LATWQAGIPRLKTLDKYADTTRSMGTTEHVGYLLRTSPDWSYVAALREEWDGKLVVKGVLDPEDAPRLVAAGVDALWVSNHAGRQFDGAPASIDVLPEIRAAAPEAQIIFDSGVEGGLDILRAIALGADFVMLGRAFHYGLGAFGPDGVRHAIHILKSDLESNMGQLGCDRLSDAAARLVR
jgi:L-lactate dehydrogenase (cytochrome)